jgi:F-type H+-transporting ATPase subunit gamma
MAAGKEIRGKIKSVENTKKITKAMEMVAASKMRKAQDRMRAARPYSEKSATLQPTWASQSRVRSRLHEDQRRQVGGLIVVTTDKGLVWRHEHQRAACRVTTKLRELQTAGVSTEAVAIGNKGWVFEPCGCQGGFACHGLGDTPHLDKLIGPVKVLLDAYAEGKINAVYLSYTKFINTMKQEPVVEQLLPLSARACRLKQGERAARLGLHL